MGLEFRVSGLFGWSGDLVTNCETSRLLSTFTPSGPDVKAHPQAPAAKAALDYPQHPEAPDTVPLWRMVPKTLIRIASSIMVLYVDRVARPWLKAKGLSGLGFGFGFGVRVLGWVDVFRFRVHWRFGGLHIWPQHGSLLQD